MCKIPISGYPSIDKPWLKYYSEEAINAPLPDCSIYEYLYENNKNYPNDIAINYFGRKITYHSLFENIDRVVKAFVSMGVKAGDIVTVALPSIPEVLYTVYALNKIGAVANMIHPLAGEQEILNYLNEVNGEVTVLYEGTYQIINSSIVKTSIKKAVVVSAAESLPHGIKELYKIKNKKPTLTQTTLFRTWKQFVEAGRTQEVPTVTKDQNTVAIISHTGGTTGVPKGVMCSDKSVDALIWQVGQTLPHKRQERMLVVLPPFVNYSLVNGMMEPLVLGQEVILIPDYKPERFADYIRKYRPNHMNTIPAYLEAILELKQLNKMDLSCLSQVYYGGESMRIETESEINKILLSRGARYPLGTGLGATEMVSSATLTFDGCRVRGAACVPFVRVNCKIVEPETQNELTYNEEGEICFSGETVMLGYYGNQAATDDIIRKHIDGARWLHTGDLGYISTEGIIFVTGRIKRIIMTKGADKQVTKLFPDRIEKAVLTHPAVELCCVIGIPDEQRINYPKAFVVPKGDSIASDHLSSEILDICHNLLPEYMVPEEIEYRTTLPRTERGKIDYRALEKETEEMYNA